MFSTISRSVLRHPLTRSLTLCQFFNKALPQCLTEAAPNTGPFGIPELLNPSGFQKLSRQVVADCDMLLEEAMTSSRRRNIVEIMDDLSNTICRVADMAECLRLIHPNAEFAAAAEHCVASLQHLVESLNTNYELYKALCDGMASDHLSDLDRHVAGLFRTEFEASGVHLPLDKRKKFVKVTQDIFQFGSEFVRGTDAPTSVQVDNAYGGLLQHFKTKSHELLVDSLCAFASDPKIREESYKHFYAVSPTQEGSLQRLLSARKELALLTGFKSFAHRSLKGTLMDNPEQASKFLNMLGSELKSKVNDDFEILTSVLKESEGVQRPVKVWDIPLLTALTKQNRFNLNEQSFKEYFTVGAVIEGLSFIFQKLYDVSLEIADTLPGELWSDDVIKLAIFHKSEGTLGYVYCDFYHRPAKFAETHYTVRGGRCISAPTHQPGSNQIQGNAYQTPVVVLALSFNRAQGSSCPSRLTVHQVDNLFHEMGHAMHSILGRTRYQHTAGTRCPTDFAEVPSNLMEYFAFDARVMRVFAKRNGEELSEDVRQRICTSRNHLLSLELLQQCSYAAFDLALHTDYCPSVHGSTTDLFTEYQRKFELPHLPNTAWHHRFSHLGPYGSKYYSYLVARAVASLVWQQCFDKDPLNSCSGQKYRCTFLAHGGEKPAMNLIENLLGYRLECEHLVEALLKEVERSKQL